MAIRVQCTCGELIDARERMAGREVRCPRCNRLVLVPGHTSPVQSTTVFALAVVAGILITLGIVLLPDWLARFQRSTAFQTRTCAMNLKALWTAIRAYVDDHDGWMPSSWDNTFALIAPYLSPAEREGEGAVWRCPLDPFLGTDPPNHCSYGINADETDGGPDDENRFHPGEAFRQAAMPGDASQGYLYPGPFAHRVRGGGERQAPVRFDQVAANTILMVEHWYAFNTLDLDQPRKPNRTGPGLRDRCALVIREYGAWRKPKFDDRGRLFDAGSCLFLKSYEGRDVPLERMYHGGRIHVLYKNGVVDLVPVSRLIEPPPRGIAPSDPLRGFLVDSPWTRFRDPGRGE